MYYTSSRPPEFKPPVTWHHPCPKCGLSIVNVFLVDAKTADDGREHLRVNCLSCGYHWDEACKDAPKLTGQPPAPSGPNVVPFKKN